MKKGKKLTGAVSMALAACLLLSACQGGAGSSSTAASGTASKTASSAAASATGTADLLTGNKYPGTPDSDMITINLQQEPPELNSMLTTDTASAVVLRETMSGLTKLDKDDKPVPDMATSWKVSDDKLTYTFELRKDAKWSNGDPVTANDFAFAWKTAMDPKTASQYGFIIADNIKGGDAFSTGKGSADQLGIKVVNDYELQVTLAKPIPYFLNLCAFQTYLPVNQKAYEKIGADKYAKDTDKIVTNGAYKISAWQHDNSITLEKNADYWDAANMGIPKIKMVMIADANTAMNALKAGQLDYTTLNADQIKMMKAQGQPTAAYVDDGIWYVQYNFKRKPFNNVKVREAFGLALDQNTFVKSVRADGSVAPTGIVPSGISGANGKLYTEAQGNIVPAYDAAKAKQLLNEGLKELGMTASQLKLTFLSSNATQAQKDAAYMQEQWKKVLGVSVDVKPLAFKARVDAMNKNDFDFVYAGWAPDYNDAMTFLDLFTTNNGNNYGKYSSTEYDDLIAKAEKESDAAKRQDYMMQAEKLAVTKDFVVSPLYFSVITYTTSAKFTGGISSGFQTWPGNYTDGAKLTK